MIEVVKELIKRKRLLDGVYKVILGYSGGPDSTFLREVLFCEKVEIIFAYFNHNLRNDSEKEEEFVKKEAKRLNLELRVDGKNVRKYCDINSFSIEEGARILRMNYLRKVKNKESADVIALGHNLDDQVENFFIRLMRGSGFGLSSMRYREEDILRPLLSLRKKNIIEYLDSNNIPYYEDPSNRDLRYLRNKIRAELIPIVEDIKSNSIKCIERSIENIKDMEKALNKNINDIHIDKYPNHIEVDRKKFEQLKQSEKFLLFSKILSFFDKRKELKRAHIESLPKEGIVELSDSLIELTKDKVIITIKGEHSEKELPVDGRLSFGDFLLTTKTIKKIEDTSKDGCEYFDLDMLELPLKVRIRKRGDNIISFGSKNKKKLKDIFINEKIPRILRDLWPVVCDSKGVILIPSLRRSNRAGISNKTKKIIQIKYKEVKNGK